MEIDDHFAFLITWTTYGTWLPGDERGHASPLVGPDGQYTKRRNEVGTRYAAGDDITKQRAMQLQQFPTVWLTVEEAKTAANGMLSAATSRHWRIHRAAVMANHIHVVVDLCPHDGSGVRRVLKGVSQAEMKSKRGESRRWWTHGGSDRLLIGERAIAAAIQYVINQHGKLSEIVDGKVVQAAGRP